MAWGTRRTQAEAPAGPGSRQGRAALSDARLWVGVGLLVGSVVVGATVMTRTADTVTVWRASRDLAMGARPNALEAVQLPVELADGTYVEASSDPQGRLRWPLPAGSLVPVAALDSNSRPDLRRVTVPVDPLHSPVELLAGAVVDVWWTAGDALGAQPGGEDLASGALGPHLVRASTVVADVTTDAVGLGGEVAVVLEVPAADVGSVVQAARSGHLDLVDAGATRSVTE